MVLKELIVNERLHSAQCHYKIRYPVGMVISGGASRTQYSSLESVTLISVNLHSRKSELNWGYRAFLAFDSNLLPYERTMSVRMNEVQCIALREFPALVVSAAHTKIDFISVR